MEKAYRNLGYILLLLIPLTFLGFYKTYFGLFPDFPRNIDVYIHLHAFIATVWVGLLILQPLVMRLRKVRLHRTLGKVSYVVFPLLILSFLPQMVRLAGSDHPEFLFFPLADSIVLLFCYSLAIYYRKQVARHMRFMVGTAIVFLSPTVGRINQWLLGLDDIANQTILYGIIFLILIGLILLDRKNGRDFRPYLLMGGIWVVHLIVFFQVY